jgi:Cdc6-like AAA superfamily ATPase
VIGEPTLKLVREAVDVEALEPLALKGKAEPVEAYRLKDVRDPVGRPAETRFVGRDQELSAIRSAWERALTDQRCELVTIVGEAGIGKSRLVAEALASVEARSVQLILDLKLDVVTVSCQLGHARPSITSDVYAHLFDRARHHADIRERMAESEFGKLLEGRSA